MASIYLNPEAAKKLKFFKVKSIGMGLKSSDWNKIISHLILHTKDETWWNLIHQLAEESFLLSKAIKDPELREKFLHIVKIKNTHTLKSSELNPLEKCL